MNWLNYHHLLYFWTVVRKGTVGAAAESLHLAQPTISAQIHALERALGHRLLVRSGRRLRPTEAGQTVFRYADEIFALGGELLDVLRGHPAGAGLKLHVGVADVVPKLVAHRILELARGLPDTLKLVCFEGKPSELLARLAVHELDIVLSDSPMNPDIKVAAYNHLLGECGVAVFGTRKLAGRYRRKFPRSLDDAPFLLPTSNTVLRRSMQQWFESTGIKPRVVGEFEDNALLSVFGQQGAGLFAAPDIIADQVRKQYGVIRIGSMPTIRERFYVISVERRVKHAAVAAITEVARTKLF